MHLEIAHHAHQILKWAWKEKIAISIAQKVIITMLLIRVVNAVTKAAKIALALKIINAINV